MPRKLIISLLVFLILVIVAGTGFMAWQRFGGGSGDGSGDGSTSSDGLPTADTGGQQVVNPSADDDGDGLTNAQEAQWLTDPKRTDTDGDGTSDAEEVKANRNPTIAGPDDVLPDGFSPGQDQNVLTEAPLQVDQYFEDGISVALDSKNYTDAYKRDYREADRTPDTLKIFARAQSVATKLPSPKQDQILLVKSDSATVLLDYLEETERILPLIGKNRAQSAVSSLFSSGNTSPIESLAWSLRVNQDKLFTQAVPPAAVSLHKLMLGYLEAAGVTYEEMLKYEDDPVRATVAVHQMDEIDKRYQPLIRQEVARIRALSIMRLNQ